jgi:hypothetical protein
MQAWGATILVMLLVVVVMSAISTVVDVIKEDLQHKFDDLQEHEEEK